MMRSRVTPPHISRDISQSTYLRIKRRPRYSYVDLFDTPVTRTIVILIILETVLFLTPKLKSVNLLFLHYSLPTYLFNFTFFCNFIDKSNIVILLRCDKNIRLASWGASLPTQSKLNPLTLGSYCTPYVLLNQNRRKGCCYRRVGNQLAWSGEQNYFCPGTMTS